MLPAGFVFDAIIYLYKAIERKLASGSHRLLYVLMLVLPLTGVIYGGV